MRVIPLGGLGDIGRNMTVLEFEGQLLLIDCGVLFPEDNHPGVDLILPGFDAIADRLDDVVGRGADPRTRGPHRRGALPAAAARRHPADRLQAHSGPGQREGPRAPDPQRGHARGRPTASGSRSAPSTSSSSPSTTRSPTRSPWPSGPRPGLILHTGDFKMDQLPAGRPDHRSARASPGSARRASTCSWSTPPTPRCPASPRRSATSPRRWSGSSAASRQRVIVACFASHVHRVQQVLDAAVAHGRKVVYVGRSMLRNMGVARDLGYLKVPGRHPDRVARHRQLPAAGGGHHLHRLAGRAAVGAVPDGQPRAPGDPAEAAATPWCWPAR